MRRSVANGRALVLGTFVVLVGILASNAYAQEQEALVQGRIVAQDSTPLAGATIAIVGSGLVSRTDSNGMFTLRHGLSGTQSIELAHPDHETLNVPPIKIPAGTLRLNAMLDRRIPVGPAGDSARAALATATGRGGRGGRGGNVAPIVVIDGVLSQRPMLGADTTKMRYATQVDIVRIDILTGNKAMQRFGSQAQGGVINITTCPPDRAGGCRTP